MIHEVFYPSIVPLKGTGFTGRGKLAVLKGHDFSRAVSTAKNAGFSPGRTPGISRKLVQILLQSRVTSFSGIFCRELHCFQYFTAHLRL
jgi:hypothetical protein